MFSYLNGIKKSIQRSSVRLYNSVQASRAGGLLGASMGDVIKYNTDGVRWGNQFTALLDHIEASGVPVEAYVITGAVAHISHRDKTDTQPVIGIRLYSSKDLTTATMDQKYLGSVHLHVDGTWKGNDKLINNYGDILDTNK